MQIDETVRYLFADVQTEIMIHVLLFSKLFFPKEIVFFYLQEIL